MVNINSLRRCSKCKREFPPTYEYFFRDRYRKDGLKSQCKECESKKKVFGLPKGNFNIDWKELDTKSGIYKITNKENNKIYIGSAVDICMRWCTHLHELRKGTHGNSYIQNAFNKYGEEKFKFEIIELVKDKNKLLEREQYWIDTTNCCDRKIGYNILKTAGNSLGNKLNEETKEKLRRILNKPIVQLTIDGEFIKEWISANEVERVLGYKSSNICIALNGKINHSNGYIWVFKSEYVKDDFNINNHRAKRAVLQYDKDGNFMKEWVCTVTEVSQSLKIKDSNISQCCFEKQTSAGGYVWRFRYNDEEYPTKIEVNIKNRVREIEQYEDKNGQLILIKKWKSAISIERELGYDRKTIVKCCKGNRDNFKGYVWKYEEAI